MKLRRPGYKENRVADSDSCASPIFQTAPRFIHTVVAIADQTKTTSVRMTLVPVEISGSRRSRSSPVAVCPVRTERIEPAVARLQCSAARGRCSLACLCGRVGDPEWKVSQDKGVWPRHAHLRARTASTQAAGRRKLADTYWETRRRGHRPTHTVRALGYCIRTGRGDSR